MAGKPLVKISNSEPQNQTPPVSYDIEAELSTANHILAVKEKLTWRNFTSYPTDKIFLHLYPNAYSSQSTKFMHGRVMKDECRSRINLKTVKVNGEDSELIFYFPDTSYRADSTVAYIQLKSQLRKHDSVSIEFEYTLPVPKALGRWGRDKDDNLYFFAQWFPKAGVYRDSYWYCEPFHSFAEFYSDFADYRIKFTLPSGFRAASSGKTLSSTENRGKREMIFDSRYVTDFSFFAYNNLNFSYEKIRNASGKEIKVSYFIRDINVYNIPRISSAVKKSVRYLEKNIGEYPYDHLTIVDILPGTGEVANMEYPGLFTFSAPYFESLETRYPEKLIIHELVHHYFYAAVSSNEIKEAWLDEGITSYLTSKIVADGYGPQSSYFRVFNYFTVTGIEFLNVNGVPVIYTLTKTPLPEYSQTLASYYKHAKSGALNQPSDQLFSAETYFAITYSKAEILLATLENYIGEKELYRLLTEYYNRYKFRHASSDDFLSVLKSEDNPEVERLLDQFYESSNVCDFAVKGFEQAGNSAYVFVQRNEDAVVPLTVALYTTNDTLTKKICPTERITRVVFKTPYKVTGAEIDPERKNLFDLNFANNSYSGERHPEGLLYIALRWFFWMQSLLIVAGGLA